MNLLRVLWLKLLILFQPRQRPCPCGGAIVWHEGKNLPGGGMQMGGASCAACGFSMSSQVFAWSDEQVQKAHAERKALGWNR